MSARRLPVRPDLIRLRHKARDLLATTLRDCMARGASGQLPEHRDLTPIGWHRRSPDPMIVSGPAMAHRGPGRPRMNRRSE